MGALEILSLMNELFGAFETIFPNAHTLQHVAAVTQVVGAVASAANPNTVATPMNPTVTAIQNSLPVVVAAVQALRAANAAPAVPMPAAIPVGPAPTIVQMS